MKKPDLNSASTRALVIFEAAVRLGSFSKAADEVHLSQSAVSRVILQLEDRLGTPLFVRHGKGVTPTPKGKKLARYVASGLHTIHRGLEETTSLGNESEYFSILASTCSSTYWLTPCLSALSEDFPEIEFRLFSSPYTIEYDQNYAPSGHDMALFDLDLKHPDFPWPNHHYECLIEEQLIPVCSPAYLDDKGEVDSLDQLAALDLVEWLWTPPRHSSVQMRKHHAWRHWFEQLENPLPLHRRNLVFADYALVVHAALSGLGVALGWSYIVNPLIKQGLLMPVTEFTVSTDRGAWLAYSRDLENNDILSRAKNALVTAMKTHVSP